MEKRIVIVGGGISGLALLHYLKKKYRGCEDVYVTLLEKNSHLGGTIHTIKEGHFTFESGPNGFLSRASAIRDLARELDLSGQMIHADSQAKIRSISVKNKLHVVPNNPISFLFMELLSFTDVVRILTEIFVPKGKADDESVFDFGKRRLGENFTKIFLDCVVSGIFGGDVKRLSMKSAFPKVYNLEQSYGSLIKGVFHLKGKKDKETVAGPKGSLMSFKGGMGEIIERMYTQYGEHIRMSETVETILKNEGQFFIKTDKNHFQADEVYLCTPSYHAAEILGNLDKELSGLLDEIFYAPIMVVGLGYEKSDFPKSPKGFGYLIPSSENRDILGVVFSSNIFPGRAGEDEILMQVMLGGAHHPRLGDRSTFELVDLAKNEIKMRFGAKSEPKKVFSVFWPKAIPQYNLGYSKLLEKIGSRLEKIPGLFLAANYIGGPSLNDCVAHSQLTSQKSRL